MVGRTRIPHRYEWLWEELLDDPSVVLRPMFGGKALYRNGHLQLHFTAKKDPWRGVLACTERENQASLLAEFPELAPHPVLPKWLYLPETADAFERVALALVQLVRRGDPRLGVPPSRKKAKGKAAAAGQAGTVRARRA